MAVQQRHMGRLLISHMSNAAPCPRAGTRPGTEDAPGSVCRSLILSGYWLRYHLLSSKTDSTIISQVPMREPSARCMGVGEGHPPPTDGGEGSSRALQPPALGPHSLQPNRPGRPEHRRLVPWREVLTLGSQGRAPSLLGSRVKKPHLRCPCPLVLRAGGRRAGLYHHIENSACI